MHIFLHFGDSAMFFNKASSQLTLRIYHLCHGGGVDTRLWSAPTTLTASCVNKKAIVGRVFVTTCTVCPHYWRVYQEAEGRLF